MHFGSDGERIELSTPGDLRLAREVIDASRYYHEKKDPPKKLSPSHATLPLELGKAASRGLMSALERAVENEELKITDETRAEAAETIARLNELSGKSGSKGLLSRTAVSLAGIANKVL